MNILITGGLGFIGSHICVKLLNDNHNLIIIDNLSNSSIDVLNNIKIITQCSEDRIIFYENNITNYIILEQIFENYTVDLVIHCAAYKSVNESIKNPLNYYHNNIYGLLSLLNVMEKYQCYKFIFSSSATVYGTQTYPVNEESSVGNGITNPYGQTKYMAELILKDLVISNNKWQIISLRYFNPVGAHSSGLIGENPNDIPNNLMPYVLKVALGVLPLLSIYGKDYDTEDGTCIRDFIHIEDLARGHLLAVNRMNEINGFEPINLGTGKGTSVLELITTFEKVNDIKLNYTFGIRRQGDLPIVYAETDKAKRLLGFECYKNLDDICIDSYNFIKTKKL